MAAVVGIFSRHGLTIEIHHRNQPNSVRWQSLSRVCHCHPFISYRHCKSGGNPTQTQLFVGVSCEPY